MDVKREIENLSSLDQVNVLRVLKEHNVPYTLNSNGYFFNLNDIQKESYTNLVDYIEKIKENKVFLEQSDALRVQCMNEYRDNIDKRIVEKHQQLERDRESRLKLVKDSVELIVSADIELVDTDPDILIKNYLESKKRFTRRLPLCIRMRKNDTPRVIKHTEGDECIPDVPVGTVDNIEVTEGIDETDVEVTDDADENEMCDYNDEDEEDTSEDKVEGRYKDEDSHESKPRVIFVSKETVDHYRDILTSQGYIFEKGNHDILVVQDYL